MSVRSFEELGFPKNSTIVLRFLLSLGEAKAGELIKETQLHRHLVYEALRDLEERGIVKKIVKGKIAVFRAVSGDALVADAERHYQAATEIANLIRRTRKGQQSAVTFYEGVEGVHEFMEYVLSQGKDICVLGANARFRSFYPEIFELWNDRRIRKHISFRALVPDEVEKEAVEGVEDVQLRRYPGKMFPGVAWIFGDHVAHIVWRTKLNTEIILLRQRELAQQHRELFSTLWEKSK